MAHDTSILREPERKLLEMRLALISATARVLRAAMGLLGIELPERM